MKTFELRSQDPSGEFVSIPWSAQIVPRKGDALMLPDRAIDPAAEPDAADLQDVTVTDVQLLLTGAVVVWVGEFDGWDHGSVVDLFANAQAARQTWIDRRASRGIPT